MTTAHRATHITCIRLAALVDLVVECQWVMRVVSVCGRTEDVACERLGLGDCKSIDERGGEINEAHLIVNIIPVVNSGRRRRQWRNFLRYSSCSQHAPVHRFASWATSRGLPNFWIPVGLVPTSHALPFTSVCFKFLCTSTSPFPHDNLL